MCNNGKPIAVCTYNGILFNYKKESSADKFYNSDEYQTFFCMGSGMAVGKTLATQA